MNVKNRHEYHVSNPNSIIIYLILIYRNEQRVINAKKVEFTHEMAQKFYGVHEGKFFYPRLYNYVRSGPVIALALQGDEIIRKWREIIGPTKDIFLQ